MSTGFVGQLVADRFRGLPPAIREMVRSAAEMAEADPLDVIRGNGRMSKQVAEARRIAAVKLRHAGLSLPEIGRVFRMHHTSVMAMLRRQPAKCPIQSREIPYPDLSGEWAI